MTFTKRLSLFTIFIFSTALATYAMEFSSVNDTTPPTRPPVLLVTNITQTSMDLEWTASTDDTGVVAYHIYEYRLGLVLTTDEHTFSTTITGLIPFSGYNFSVSASDAAGNESDQRYGDGWQRTEHSTCGVINTWIGGTANWKDDHLNWSEGAVANECQGVLIDNGATVTADNDLPNQYSHNREYLISTLEVGLGSEFIVEEGAEFHIIPSKTGPYTISGYYVDQEPDCPMYCYQELAILDSTTCWFVYQGDILVSATYTISGNIITVTPTDTYFTGSYTPVYRIIDDNTIVELGTADVLTK